VGLVEGLEALTELVGVLPAAGHARRLGEIGGSKEVLPLPGRDGGVLPAAHGALEQMREAGVARACMVVREGKTDIPARLGDGRAYGVPLEFVSTPGTDSSPATIDVAYTLVSGADVALAWPDVLYEPADALARTVARLEEFDIALGSYPTRPGGRFDVLDVDPDGTVRHLVGGASGWTWALAGWRPQFTEFLHAFLAAAPPGERELVLNDVFEAALGAGMRLGIERFPDGSFLDIGTPEDLARARQARGTRRRWRE
jgi:glucose-1-phosphate thymidylyltransferase